nr:dockerin type I repeat-containing protein [Ruminococcus sp.]
MRSKKAIPLLTAAALFFGMPGMDALAGDSNAEIRYYGDLDGDEVISSYDLVMLRQCIYDYERFDTAQHYISDLDADGTIGKKDLELLSDYLLGKISAFPAGIYITKDIYAPVQGNFIEPSITAMGASMPSHGEAGMAVFCVDFPDCRFSAEPDMNEMEAAVFGAEDTFSPMYPFESIAAFYKRTSKGTMNVTGNVFRYTTKENKSAYDTDKAKLAKECF